MNWTDWDCSCGWTGGVEQAEEHATEREDTTDWTCPECGDLVASVTTSPDGVI